MKNILFGNPALFSQVGTLQESHGFNMVMDAETGLVCVEKRLTVYEPTVFTYIALHPMEGIPKILALYEEDGVLSVIEELIDGVTLEHKLCTEGPLPESVAAGIIHRILSILIQLHGAPTPIIHRDIKPSNVMLTKQGQVYLIDLNAAKWSISTEKRDTQLIGTEGYAAPEQYGFDVSSPQTDLYAVGVLFNQLLTGHMLQEEITNGRYADFIRTCTQMDKKSRFPSAERARKALGGHWNKQSYVQKPALARFIPPGFRTRHPLKAAACTLFYFILLRISLLVTDDFHSPLHRFSQRAATFLCVLLPFLFTCNYLNIQQKCGLTRIKNLFLRYLCIIAIDVALLFTVALIFVLIEILAGWD